MMAPKSFGGLGFGSLRAFNTALITKWLWKMKVNVKAMWVKVILVIHKSNRIWKFFPLQAEISGVWKKMLKIILEYSSVNINLHELFKKVLGCGDKPSIWHKCWAEEGTLAKKYPLLYKLEANKMCSLADRWILVNSTIYCCWNWKRRPRTHEELLEIENFSQEINQININTLDDGWRWLGVPQEISLLLP